MFITEVTNNVHSSKFVGCCTDFLYSAVGVYSLFTPSVNAVFFLAKKLMI